VKLRVLWVGRTQEAWVKAGIEEYEGRLKRYFPLTIAEAKEEKGAQAEAGREAECVRLARLVPKNARLILLDERGEELPSLELARFLGRERDQGTPELAFVIGGAYGFSDDFRMKAHKTIALSRMTFTHQMVRVFLLEQLYRAGTILNNEGYHH
jgi:23S rRNA (pseudouridine1915-N3)-methyltransferase